MTEQEQIDRETLLKRAAAVAGAMYVAPVLASAASAEPQECPTFLCSTKRKRRICRRVGQGKGRTCDCEIGQICPCTHCGGCEAPCNHTGPTCGPLLELCPGCGGNGACFQDASGGTDGVCVDLRDGMCASFSPCAAGNSCPGGQACFATCCPTNLCSDCCSGGAAPAPRTAGSGGAGMLYASA